MTKNEDPNPFNFEDHVLESLADTSSKIYDVYYDLLATYHFDFGFAEKAWMLESIVKDITAMNELARQENGDI